MRKQFMEFINNFTNPSGNGGSGEEEMHPYVVHHQYVQAEDAITSSTGQTIHFCNNYCTDGVGCYWAVVTNNDGGLDNPSPYRGRWCTITKNINGTNMSQTSYTGVFTRYANVQGGVDNNKSFYLYAGAVIDVYYVPYNFPEVTE